MVKISLNSGHLVNVDPGACANGYTEAELVEIAQNETSRVLRAEYVVDLEDTDKLYTDDVIEANAFNADYAIEYHLNSASASAHGFETFVYTGHAPSLTLQRGLHAPIFDILKKYGVVTTDRGQKQSTQYHYLKATKMPAIIIEFCFISNKNEADAFAKHAKSIGADVAHVIARACNLPKKSVSTPTPPVSTDEVVQKRYAQKGQFIPNVAEGSILVRTEPKFTSKTNVAYVNGEICPAAGQYYIEVVETNKYVYIVYKRGNGSLGYLPVRERVGSGYGKLWGTIR
ncbi:MAG: N-acetylmuramoyl-L-alanine amidase [Bacilli bacterium]